MHITTTHQLTGPCEAPYALSGVTKGDDFYFVGTALTAKVATFNFNLPHCKAAFAVWRHVWRPRSYSTTARLINFDDGPHNIVEMARVTGTSNTNPINAGIDITSSLQRLIDNKVLKNISFQIAGDNTNTWEIFESSLEITWCIS